MRPPRPDSSTDHRLHGIDDMRGGNAESVEQLGRLAASRNLADRQSVHANPCFRHGIGHGVTDTTRLVMIFHGDDPPASSRSRRQQRITIDRGHGIQVDHTYCGS